MKVLPILFNTDMVRAILEGRKTETRRLMKPQPNASFDRYWECYTAENGQIVVLNNTYCIGDILYVRETWSTRPSNHCYAQPCHGGVCPHKSCDLADSPCFPDEYIFKASDSLPDLPGEKWRPSIHMPKEAARIFLRVTEVRVERLQEITDHGARQEGCGDPDVVYYNGALECEFADLWNSTIQPADLDNYGWEANPWVWVIEFERCKKPEVV